ncbi:MAG: class I SAM-dependent methyltransferase [Bdellovibrionales bacterium]|nr:class I SAM-dependent methyltransferase [Bdellovibrionales bacterium]
MSDQQQGVSPAFASAFQTYQKCISAIEKKIVERFTGRAIPISQEDYEMLPLRMEKVFRSLILEKTLTKAFEWMFESRETSNWTYDLRENSKAHLASLIAHIGNVPIHTVEQYFAEIQNDLEFSEHIRTISVTKRNNGNPTDPVPRFGRRLGWYALARICKPKVIIETGLDKGLGSVTLAAALRRNVSEGYPGHYYGLDIHKNTGFLLSGAYAPYGTIVIQDSVEFLKTFKEQIDLLILDGCHLPEHEENELALAEPRLTPSSIIISDTSQSPILDFAKRTNREFQLFIEKSQDYWHPGVGNTIAFPCRTRREGFEHHREVPRGVQSCCSSNSQKM